VRVGVVVDVVVAMGVVDDVHCLCYRGGRDVVCVFFSKHQTAYVLGQ